MQRPARLGESENQAAWPILVISIVLDDLAAVGYRFLQLPDSNITKKGLIDRMLGKLVPPPSYLTSDFRKHVHAPILPCYLLQVNPASGAACRAAAFQSPDLCRYELISGSLLAPPPLPLPDGVWQLFGWPKQDGLLHGVCATHP